LKGAAMNENKATLPGGLRLQFTPQDYQTRAVSAVVQAFEGQPISSPGFRLQQTSGSVEYAPDGSIANQLLLTEEQISQNVQKIQRAMAEEQEKQGRKPMPVIEKMAADRRNEGKKNGFAPFHAGNGNRNGQNLHLHQDHLRAEQGIRFQEIRDRDAQRGHTRRRHEKPGRHARSFRARLWPCALRAYAL
jgi:hypothetical protein